MLLRQGADIDLVLRLIAASFRTRQNGTDITYYNRPMDASYDTFRQLVTPISTILIQR